MLECIGLLSVPTSFGLSSLRDNNEWQFRGSWTGLILYFPRYRNPFKDLDYSSSEDEGPHEKAARAGVRLHCFSCWEDSANATHSRFWRGWSRQWRPQLSWDVTMTTQSPIVNVLSHVHLDSNYDLVARRSMLNQSVMISAWTSVITLNLDTELLKSCIRTHIFLSLKVVGWIEHHLFTLLVVRVKAETDYFALKGKTKHSYLFS